MQRNVREIADIHKLDVLPRLLGALAQVAGQPCNFAQLGGQLGIDHKTALRYLAIFEHLYLLRRIPVWSGNALARIVKTPRFQFIDSGLLAVLSGLTQETLARDRGLFGRLLESFVFGDLRGLRKLAALAGSRFVAGIVLYDGEQVLPMGEKLWFSPLSTLWM